MMSALVLRRFLPVFTLALLCALAVAQAGFSGSAQGAPLATGNIAVREGDNAGEVVVSWDAVPQATHYRIGYVNMEVDYFLATNSCTKEWIEAFIYVDVNARNILFNSDGRAEYTIRRLSPGAAHAFTVLTSNDFVDTGGGESVSSEFFWPPKGSRWERLAGREILPPGITLPTGECYVPGAVAIPDPLLRTAIEEALDKAPGEPITADEMATLEELVPDYPGHPGYSSLEGLQYATNMTTLELRNESPFEGKLTDLSPLSGLAKLTNLTIWFSNVSDLSPLSSLTKLTNLNLFWSNISDVSPLSSLTELTYLSLRSNNVADLSPLSNLAKLTNLDLSYNVFFDISSLSNLTELTSLNLSFNDVSDLSSLSNFTALTWLNLGDNNVSDLSPLSNLAALTWLDLENNNISNLAPLVANAGLGLGDEVYVVGNPLDDASINTHIPVLQSRGVAIDGKLDVAKLNCPDSENYRVYNDNLFILSVTQHSVTEEPPIQYYVTCFYRYYVDGFDFLMLLDNVGDDEDITLPYHGIYASVRNDVEGVGQRIYSPGDRWGAVEKLQGVMHFPKAGYIRSGPTLHELMHRWANYVVPSISHSHWGFSSADGQLGGFDIDNLINHGDGRYSAGHFGPFANGGNRVPYSPIELYLAGFIPPEDVPDLWVAEDGEWLDSEDGAPVLDDNGFGMFTASKVRTYSIEDIIAEHGRRVPDYTQAQHDFRAAAILLIDEDHPATEEILDLVSSDVAWFSHPGNDDHYLFNFYEATGGKGTMAMDGLSQFRKKP